MYHSGQLAFHDSPLEGPPSRMPFLACSVLSLTVAGASAAPADASVKPNFVFILVDETGWADVRCFGSDFY